MNWKHYFVIMFAITTLLLTVTLGTALNQTEIDQIEQVFIDQCANTTIRFDNHTRERLEEQITQQITDQLLHQHNLTRAKIDTSQLDNISTSLDSQLSNKFDQMRLDLDASLRETLLPSEQEKLALEKQNTELEAETTILQERINNLESRNAQTIGQHTTELQALEDEKKVWFYTTIVLILLLGVFFWLQYGLPGGKK